MRVNWETSIDSPSIQMSRACGMSFAFLIMEEGVVLLISQHISGLSPVMKDSQGLQQKLGWVPLVRSLTSQGGKCYSFSYPRWYIRLWDSSPLTMKENRQPWRRPMDQASKSLANREETSGQVLGCHVRTAGFPPDIKWSTIFFLPQPNWLGCTHIKLHRTYPLWNSNWLFLHEMLTVQ